MSASGVALIPLWKLIEKLDIAGQSHPDMRPFDQIMTQYALFGKSSREHAAEGAHIVDSLALVRSFTAEVLIDIRDSLGVRVDADRIGEKPTENRGPGTRERRTHPRLDDGVGAGHERGPGHRSAAD